jgi:oligopeptide/dipeptide ABC transporter ATP-binding protein
VTSTVHTSPVPARAESSTDAAPLLRVRDLRASFTTPRGRLPVIDEVSFSLDRGQTLGIVGESGCGKSMLALSLVRLMPAAARIDSGSVEWMGTDLTRLSERALNRIRGGEIGIVFQDPISSLNPTRRIGSQIAEVLTKHQPVSRKAALRRSVELLEEVRIPRAAERVDAFPHELSGGMCQRAMIAMAIACAPKLIIADEPTTALDATIQAQVLALLDELRQAHGMAMIIISHDVRVVARTADRVAVMYAGELVEEAATARLFSAPQHPYTDALLRAVPRLDEATVAGWRLPTISGRPPRLGEWAPGCRFAPRCPVATPDDECLSEHPALRGVADDHWARTDHPTGNAA